jgi:hypothetical protein
MVRIGDRDVAANDLGVLGAGLLLFIASFLDWFKLGGSYTDAAENAWGVGFFGYTGVELGLLAAVLVALRVFARRPLPTVPLGWEMLLTIIAGLGTLLVLLKLAVGMNVLGTGDAFDPAIGLWLALAASVVLTGLCGLTLAVSRGWQPPSRRQPDAGGQPSWQQQPPGYEPPPPGGYGPPPSGYDRPPQGGQAPQPPLGYGEPPRGGYGQPPAGGYGPQADDPGDRTVVSRPGSTPPPPADDPDDRTIVSRPGSPPPPPPPPPGYGVPPESDR